MKNYNPLLPDFLGIGAPRSGSTWLHMNLYRHPDIWIPHRKELHYFDRSPSYPSPSHLSSNHPLSRLIGREDYNKKFRLMLAKTLTKNICTLNMEQLSWEIKYFFGRYNDQWYASLFKRGKDKTKGEITPAYSILELQDVEHIRNIMPDVKIIYFLRNPIYRAWSSLRKNFVSTRPLEELKKIIDQPATLLRCDYLRTISIWRKFFAEEQIFIGFYEEIKQNPQDLLLRLYKFLGVEEAEKYTAQSAYQKINKSSPMVIPNEVKVYLTRKFFPQIKELNKVVGNYSKQWVLDAETTLGE